MIWPIAGGIGQIKSSGLPFSVWSTVNSGANAGGGPPPSYWGPPNGTAITFSNQNRSAIATATGGIGTGSSTSYKTSGQLYVEVTIGAALTDNGYAGVGIGCEDFLLSSYVGYSPGSIGLIGSTVHWSLYNSGSAVGYNFGPPADGDVVGMAVKISGGVVAINFRLNGNWLNQGASTPTFPTSTFDAQITRNSAIVCHTVYTSAVNTINAGSVAFAYAAPAGYTAWK